MRQHIKNIEASNSTNGEEFSLKLLIGSGSEDHRPNCSCLSVLHPSVVGQRSWHATLITAGSHRTPTVLQVVLCRPSTAGCPMSDAPNTAGCSMSDTPNTAGCPMSDAPNTAGCPMSDTPQYCRICCVRPPIQQDALCQIPLILRYPWYCRMCYVRCYPWNTLNTARCTMLAITHETPSVYLLLPTEHPQYCQIWCWPLPVENSPYLKVCCIGCYTTPSFLLLPQNTFKYCRCVSHYQQNTLDTTGSAVWVVAYRASSILQDLLCYVTNRTPSVLQDLCQPLPAEHPQYCRIYYFSYDLQPTEHPQYCRIYVSCYLQHTLNTAGSVTFAVAHNALNRPGFNTHFAWEKCIQINWSIKH